LLQRSLELGNSIGVQLVRLCGRGIPAKANEEVIL